MTQATNDLAAGLHAMWGAVADGWGEHADFVDARSAALTARMLDRAALRPGERVLELAGGAGGLGMAAAEQVGPDGEVVLSDVAAEMTAIAARRAAARGIGNVTARELDLEGIAEPDASFDVVLCREGLMFALDPAQAAGEIRRVLRPGGRFAVAVWGPRERNPWLGIVLDAVSEQLGAPVPPPGIPGPFSLGDAAELRGLLDAEVEEVSVPLRVPSFDAWWSRTTALAGPLAKMLAVQPPETIEAIRHRAREAVRSYETADGLELPGISLLASGRRP
ncbi:MAG: class I SAM-dependent methyltransferase [Solirubrobacteraceae bacterium]